MPESQAAEVFLWVASICVVALTLLAGVVGYFAVRVLLEARALVRRVQKGAEYAAGSIRFAGRWLRVVERRVLQNFKD